MPRQPLAEVFGFPIDNHSPDAIRTRKDHLCPFGNKVPNCTKDKAADPLGVCSVFDGNRMSIICPVRFREKWLVASDAARFFFPNGVKWTSLTEVRLNDAHGKSAGNIDVVLVSYDSAGNLLDFGALEVQAVYISGTIRTPFAYYMSEPQRNQHMDWQGKKNYPHPDYVSSSRKRLAPQLLFKGGILNKWGKRQAVAVDTSFFATLPTMDEVAVEDADLAWLVYDLIKDATRNVYEQKLARIAYTRFIPTLNRLTVAEPGDVSTFVKTLQKRLKDKLTLGKYEEDEDEEELPPDAPTLQDTLGE